MGGRRQADMGCLIPLSAEPTAFHLRKAEVDLDVGEGVLHCQDAPLAHICLHYDPHPMPVRGSSTVIAKAPSKIAGDYASMTPDFHDGSIYNESEQNHTEYFIMLFE